MDEVRIFISYAREDEARVKQLYQRLAGAGFQPWLDREHIIPGMKWEPVIKKALKQSDFVLVCLSATSINKRGFLQREIKQALEQAEEKLEHDVYLIPARLDDCEMPDSLSEIQWVDLFEDDGWQQLLGAFEYGLKQRGKAMPAPVSSAARIETAAQLHSSPTRKSFTENLNGVPLEMIYVPGGSFKMGSPKGTGYDRERLQHDVTVPDFFIGKYQITQAQWQAVMNKNPSFFKGDPALPVENISWNDAKEFCGKLAQMTGKAYRLPSEAEWEYACRAGTTGDYAGDLYAMAWYSENSKSKTHPVGQKQPNAFGLYDMHGNVWEWCEDVWHDSYKDAPIDGSAWLSGGDSSLRVVRGGSWYSYGGDCRSAFRDGVDPSTRVDYLGVRVVVSARIS
ncbi:MAG: SUMF1/EgtB/PvdO family nonheme iron enzyme [Blastocatellales bacterium]